MLGTTIGSSKRALVLISLIVVATIVDSHFINVFYGINLGSPGNYHLLLYISLVIIVSIITIILLRFTERNGGSVGNNQSIVFLGNPAFAVDKNVNSRNQKCEISSNQLIYLTVYPGECSTGGKPHEGEFPDMKNPADLLNCAQDSNRVMKLMQVKVDGQGCFIKYCQANYFPAIQIHSSCR